MGFSCSLFAWSRSCLEPFLFTLQKPPEALAMQIVLQIIITAACLVVAAAAILGLKELRKVAAAAAAAPAWRDSALHNVERVAVATVNLERRSMEQNLTGAETGRLMLQILDEYDPHGDPSTWR